NGVVLITTKHAKPGESKLTIDADYGIQKIPENKVPKMMNARQYAQYMKDRHDDAVLYERPPVPALNPVYQHPEQYGEGTNWFKVVTQTAPMQRYNITLLSSREHASSALMAGYQSQDGVLINTGTKLFTARLNNEYSFINNKLKVGFNLAPSYRIDHNNRLTTDGLTGIFLFALEASPLGKPTNPDGSYPYNVNSPGMVTNVNPYAELKTLRNNYYTTRILGNGYASYEIIPGLLLKVNVGADKGAETFSGFSPSILSANGIATGSSTAYDNYSWTAETNLQYSKTFGEHSLEALVGYSGEQYTSFNNAVAGQGFASDDVPYLSAASTITSGATNTSQFSLVSAIGRVNYAYRNRYLLSGAIRQDGSSRFGNNKKYGYFPSVSAGWIVSDENFMKNISSLDFLKIRASYGITGNNNIGNYTFISSIGNNLNYYANGGIYQGATITTLGNDDLAWERNRQFDAGLDMSVLKGRINFTYDYYYKITDGMIQNRPIPRASGFSTIRYNTGKFAFWGHEFTVSTVNLTGKLKWTTSFNISVDRNMIRSLVSPGYIDYGSTGASNYFRNAVGHPLGMFFGYVFDGLYKDAADLANSPKYSGGSTFSDVGTIKFKDLNGDKVVEDVHDRTFIGNPTPTFMYGMTNNLSYKHLDLSISIAGQAGGDLLNVNKWTHLVNMDGARNLLADAANHWRSSDNPGSGIYPRTETNTTAIGRYANSQWVEKGSYLAVKNISLGYTLKVKDNKAFQSLRIFGSVQQAFVFTGYTGMTPEANLTGLDATKGIGIDVSQYPVPRTFSLGLSANFK
ncbi:MAG TPA: SusC/RagA family TonB-linked outer membrane protein, partial [Chitinophaga sp.]